MPQEDKNKISDDIRIKVKSSELAEFTKRNLPSDEEVRQRMIFFDDGSF